MENYKYRDRQGNKIYFAYYGPIKKYRVTAGYRHGSNGHMEATYVVCNLDTERFSKEEGRRRVVERFNAGETIPVDYTSRSHYETVIENLPVYSLTRRKMPRPIVKAAEKGEQIR